MDTATSSENRSKKSTYQETEQPCYLSDCSSISSTSSPSRPSDAVISASVVSSSADHTSSHIRSDQSSFKCPRCQVWQSLFKIFEFIVTGRLGESEQRLDFCTIYNEFTKEQANSILTNRYQNMYRLLNRTTKYVRNPIDLSDLTSWSWDFKCSRHYNLYKTKQSLMNHLDRLLKQADSQCEEKSSKSCLVCIRFLSDYQDLQSRLVEKLYIYLNNSKPSLDAISYRFKISDSQSTGPSVDVNDNGIDLCSSRMQSLLNSLEIPDLAHSPDHKYSKYYNKSRRPDDHFRERAVGYRDSRRSYMDSSSSAMGRSSRSYHSQGDGYSAGYYENRSGSRSRTERSFYDTDNRRPSRPREDWNQYRRGSSRSNRRSPLSGGGFYKLSTEDKYMSTSDTHDLQSRGGDTMATQHDDDVDYGLDESNLSWNIMELCKNEHGRAKKKKHGKQAKKSDSWSSSSSSTSTSSTSIHSRPRKYKKRKTIRKSSKNREISPVSSTTSLNSIDSNISCSSFSSATSSWSSSSDYRKSSRRRRHKKSKKTHKDENNNEVRKRKKKSDHKEKKSSVARSSSDRSSNSKRVKHHSLSVETTELIQEQVNEITESLNSQALIVELQKINESVKKQPPSDSEKPPAAQITQKPTRQHHSQPASRSKSESVKERPFVLIDISLKMTDTKQAEKELNDLTKILPVIGYKMSNVNYTSYYATFCKQLKLIKRYEETIRRFELIEESELVKKLDMLRLPWLENDDEEALSDFKSKMNTMAKILTECSYRMKIQQDYLSYLTDLFGKVAKIASKDSQEISHFLSEHTSQLNLMQTDLVNYAYTMLSANKKNDLETDLIRTVEFDSLVELLDRFIHVYELETQPVTPEALV